MKIVNPANGLVIREINEDSAFELNIKLNNLKEGKSFWAAKNLEERIAVINKFSLLLAQNIEELAAILTSEVGKPLQQSRNEINGAIARINYFIENSVKFLSEEIVTNNENLTEKITYEPLGIVCNISAWNYPYLVGVNVFIPALIGGNAVFYKPSEYAILTGLEIEKYLKLAGIAENVFQVAIGEKEVGKQLLNMDLDGYFFTGSYATGQYIYEKVAPKMVPCQLELGGKDPLYVAEDVPDIKAVAAATADGAFYNNGQSCCAVERIYVHESVYDAYIQAFVEEVKSFKIGEPTAENVYIGALTRKEQIKILEIQIEDALAKGAILLCGGKKIERSGNYFEPTVLVNVTNEMKVMRDESFGPIIGIMKVKNDDQALDLMADTEFGLTASVYTASKERAESILKQLNVGTGYWNCCDRVSATLPWSGRQHSGFGATLSQIGIRAFVRPKAFHLRSS